jgi:hypothetical protein
MVILSLSDWQTQFRVTAEETRVRLGLLEKSERRGVGDVTLHLMEGNIRKNPPKIRDKIPKLPAPYPSSNENVARN